MSKVKAENKELAVVEAGSFLPTEAELEENVIAPESKAYLPYLEMVFPIMTDDIYEGHNWEIGFRNGTDFEALKEGTILTVVDMRNAIKRTYVNEDGKRKNEYAYSSIKRNKKEFNKSSKRFVELLPQAQDKSVRDINLGVSMVIVAIKDEKATLLDFSAFKTMNGYMYPFLSPAKLQKGIGMQLNLSNHKCNLIKAKTSGHLYPSSNKFTQWEHVQLTKEQGKLALSVLNEKTDAYMNWLDQ